MHILISDANIPIDMHDGDLVKEMFKLPFRFVIPDIIYVEELEEYHGYLIGSTSRDSHPVKNRFNCTLSATNHYTL